jgi:hypothetical protein
MSKHNYVLRSLQKETNECRQLIPCLQKHRRIALKPLTQI